MILFLLSIGKWMKDKEKTHAAKQVLSPSKKNMRRKVSSPAYLEKNFNKVITTDCPDFEAVDRSLIKERESLAKNLHFQKNSGVFRLRTFIEDGDNGSFVKLVYYKEDAEGFPRIQQLPKGKEINPSKAYLESFLKNAEVIHEEEDYRLELTDGRELTISEINGEIVKLNSQQDDCFYEK